MENVGRARSALTVNIFIIFLLFRCCLGTRLGLRFFFTRFCSAFFSPCHFCHQYQHQSSIMRRNSKKYFLIKSSRERPSPLMSPKHRTRIKIFQPPIASTMQRVHAWGCNRKKFQLQLFVSILSSCIQAIRNIITLM